MTTFNDIERPEAAKLQQQSQQDYLMNSGINALYQPTQGTSGKTHCQLDSEENSSDVIATINEYEADVLRAKILLFLEHKALTPSDISCRLMVSEFDIKDAFVYLYRNGLIDKIESNILFKILPSLKKRRYPDEVNSEKLFTLTSKGYFNVHPVIFFGHQ
jgi:hypothetical protein